MTNCDLHPHKKCKIPGGAIINLIVNSTFLNLLNHFSLHSIKTLNAALVLLQASAFSAAHVSFLAPHVHENTHKLM